jgi:hypothetical protein
MASTRRSIYLLPIFMIQMVTQWGAPLLGVNATRAHVVMISHVSARATWGWGYVEVHE